MTLFVGNLAESAELLLKIKDPAYTHVRWRFFLHEHHFAGIQNATECRQCLASYDTYRYPEPDGPTYTEAFVPELYREQWRLQHWYKLVWHVYCEKFKNVYQLTSWPMRYFVITINILLMDYLPRYGSVNDTDAASIIFECIDASGVKSCGIQPVKAKRGRHD